MDTTKDAYKQKMEAQLKLWSAQFDGFKAKADKATSEAKVEILKQVDELKAFEVSAKKHIADVSASAADSWQKARSGFEDKWNQLSGSVEAMWAKVAPTEKSKS